MRAPPNGNKPFVFVDKSVLLAGQPFNVDPARLRFASAWNLGLERLFRAGLGLAVVSNESGIAFGYYGEHALDVMHRHVAARFASRGLEVAGFLYCPHHAEGTVREYARTCECHLPQPGLLWRGATELGADLRRSWLVGDSPDDVAAARKASCRFILVDSGHESELLVTRRQPQTYHVAPDLCAAADLIIAEMIAEAAA